MFLVPQRLPLPPGSFRSRSRRRTRHPRARHRDHRSRDPTLCRVLYHLINVESHRRPADREVLTVAHLVFLLLEPNGDPNFGQCRVYRDGERYRKESLFAHTADSVLPEADLRVRSQGIPSRPSSLTRVLVNEKMWFERQRSLSGDARLEVRA
jgi:hypothetical protein